MTSEVIEQLQASDDPLERELGQALLKWQDDKEKQGLPRSLGYEPREIREKGAVAVIEARVANGSSGFEEIDKESSYEAIVLRHHDRFSDMVVEKARRRLQSSNTAASLFEDDLLTDELPRFWVEKAIVQGRPDRQEGPDRLGEALWSPQKAKNGADIYSNMRRVSRGDIVLHLTDNLGFSGVSEVAEPVNDEFIGISGTDWADQPGYRVQLQNFRKLDPSLSREHFLKDPEIGPLMKELAESASGKGLFYNRKLELNQGAYLSEASPALVHLLNQAYFKVVGRKLVDLPELPQPSKIERAPVAEYTIEDALEELFLERDEVEKYLDTWRNKKNLILQGAPGVGKSFIARRLAYALIGFQDDTKVQTVQFHQSYSYEDFVQGYRPNGSQGFERKNGSFHSFCERAVKDPYGTYVFIIDEINRGNLSKIFGELMLLIEPDKRERKWATRLAYATDQDPDFFVPANLHIIGMMNTADRSLSLVDYALRRRFSFISMEPLYGAPKFRSYLEMCGVPNETINQITTGMGELNQAIESDRVNLGPGFRIGHSFFTPNGTVVDADLWYRRVIETEIHPLLEEYWFDAPETADHWRDKLLG